MNVLRVWSRAGRDRTDDAATTVADTETGSVLDVFLVALRLGLTSFGGPIAHLGYFRAEYVQRRKWLDEASYADLVALSQFLPGPGSSKLGMSIGILRRGVPGGLAAWLGFTLPSAVLMVLFAYGADALGSSADGWIHGLKVVAVAVVALAVWSMARNLAWDRRRGPIAIVAAAVMLAWPAAAAQVLVIVGGALIGWRFLRDHRVLPRLTISVPIGRRMAAVCWALFFGLLIALPVARQVTDNHAVATGESFYRAGSLVFGGGHVVLPLLESSLVNPGWVSEEEFLAGYGAAQAVPGPLFTFSAYLGTVLDTEPNGVPGAGFALVAIFLPAFLLTMGVLPLWEAIRSRPAAQAALRGVNAAVVGILLAALWRPVITSAIDRPADVALAAAAFLALAVWKAPPWLVVLLTAAGGALVTQIW